ncbi:MAG: HAD family phosphatase [Bacteroidetes Order II. Incertae sedis bacterium]|jgi:hydroxymethylpyrimidine pyrophosphatase-like HAD family hydrolase|nr:HAD family phosphatase [Bacteroidetes Order II. bacterium]MBT4051940.1 HAD family phosphatase [Bacteroidetes Order II. bacterium]MBT4602634.1 HAD family phosphatase [Bacteroidetes Order II. bacterium]MBT5250465.1 HAD family phosphatase [Bacteroidetes Order II. bacterium]MBT6199807.1 HAD family phosphatase [Bacteroidetes Order II. bacterium]
MPYQPLRLDVLGRISKRALTAGLPGSHASIPALSICSGRSYPYVEAMSQLLALKAPVLFESGAGMFDPVSALTIWHPALTTEIQREVDEIREYMTSLLALDSALSIDHAKRAQAGMVAKEKESLYAALENLKRWVGDNFPHFQTFHTHISIDIVPQSLTKAAGMTWLAETCGVTTDEMAFIGDTNGDIGAMNVVGRSFAPSNSSHDAIAAASHASSFRDADAVLEAYNMLSA